MKVLETVLISVLVLMPWARRAQDKPTPVVPPDVASGKLAYMDYCAASRAR